MVRLTHPFPSFLDALATLSMAFVAGAAAPVAIRLATSMLLLQASIGALNDVVDAGWDAGRKPGKPIPRGRATRRAGLAVWGGGLLGGLALSAPSGGPTVAVALAGAACGYAYDLRLSRTGWSWLPLAAALPLLPIHAWLGTTGAVPGAAPALVSIGVLAGAGLALANGIVDIERDAASRLRTAAVRLGPRAAWWIHLLAMLAAIAVAVVLLPSRHVTLIWVGIAVGVALVALGSVLLRNPGATVRERGWEAEAVGVALLGASWVAAMAGA